jgi:hypothetical protein
VIGRTWSIRERTARVPGCPLEPPAFEEREHSHDEGGPDHAE